MKRILFVINQMNTGGIQTAFLQLLQQISDRYEIDLLCISGKGELLQDVPAGVRLLTASKALKISDLTVSEAKAEGLFYGALRAVCSAWAKLISKRLPAYAVTKFLQKSIGDYDVAVSYTQPVTCKRFFNLSNETVLNACRAKKKVTFVHCDFLRYGGNDACNRALYRKFDCIAAVSDSVGLRLAEAIPDVQDKIVTVRNCCDFEAIRGLAKIDPVVYEEEFPIVTVARLSEEKGLVRCVALFKRLRQAGYDVKWHIIGSGPCEQQLKDEIAANDAGDYVLLHGLQRNPYRYMAGAKLFLLPSYHEAAPMVFDEAAALAVPVLTTDTVSAAEMVEKTSRGWVCGMSDEDIYGGLLRFCRTGGEKPKGTETDDNGAIEQFESVLSALYED